MFETIFETPTQITDEQELRSLFGSDRLHLHSDSRLTFEGRIVLGAEVAFSGDCRLSGDNEVGQGSILTDVRLGRGTRVRPYSILTEVDAGDRNLFGPFCFVRDGCNVGDDCIVGAHVEMARSRLASGVKISHRAFVGDAEVGEGAIIGAGVVFCNWDGAARRPTQVGARAILGSGVLLVAPLNVGDFAVIGAGSTITKDVGASAKIIQKR